MRSVHCLLFTGPGNLSTVVNVHKHLARAVRWRGGRLQTISFACMSSDAVSFTMVPPECLAYSEACVQHELQTHALRPTAMLHTVVQCATQTADPATTSPLKLMSAQHGSSAALPRRIEMPPVMSSDLRPHHGADGAVAGGGALALGAGEYIPEAQRLVPCSKQDEFCRG